jgi:hypothetical protein
VSAISATFAFRWSYLELYLKALQVIETGAHLQGHALNKLFRVLKKNHKKRVTELYDEWRASKTGNWYPIKEVLLFSNQAFEHWRYPHQYPNLRYGAHGIIGPVKRVIRECGPQYETLFKYTGR